MKSLILFAAFLFTFILSANAFGSDKVTATIVQIEQFSLIIEKFKEDTGRYPNSIQGLKSLYSRPKEVANWDGPYINKKIPLDYWGNEYVYVFPAKFGNKSYDLYSIGRNKINDQGNKDDITNWRKPNLSYYYNSSKTVLKLFLASLLLASIIIVFLLRRRRTRGH